MVIENEPSNSGIPLVQYTNPNNLKAWCPAGLEYLRTATELKIFQKSHTSEVVTGIEAANQFRITTPDKHPLYFANEDIDDCAACCYGNDRPYEMNITDAATKMNVLIKLNKPYALLLESMNVEAPPGHPIGTIERQFSLMRNHFDLLNANGAIVLTIKQIDLFAIGTVDFYIYTVNQEHIGTITKHWSGATREFFTDADNFSVTFPRDLDIGSKIMCLAAVILIVSFI